MSAPTRYQPDRYRRMKARQLANPLGFQPGQDILSAIGRYGYLTSDQVRRLLYAPGSSTFVTQWLKTLKAAGYVHDDNWLRVNATGKNPRVWTFTDKGRRLLTQKDQTELPRIHHRRVPQPWVLEHLVAANEALVTCELLARESGGVIELLGLRSDEMLHKMPMTIDLAGKRQDVVPDGWAAYGFEGKPFRTFCIEVDRGTEAISKWRSKVRSYILALSGNPSAYTQTFGFEGTTVMTVARPKEGVRLDSPEKRIHDLMKWTELELTELSKKNWAPLFRFTTLAPEEMDARIFFGSNAWETPFSLHKTPLWEGVL